MDILTFGGRVLFSVVGDTLRGADLQWANLRGANLRGVDLRWANLQWADLQWADLQWADLRGANLREANLREANLRWADLQWADLREANLREANLREAKLREAKLREAKLPDFQLPEGELVAWKRARGALVRLLIPREARRTASLVGRKCRAEYAFVTDIIPDNPGEAGVVKSAGSEYDAQIVYRIGEEVWPDRYDDNPGVECTHGIHFYCTRAEAERE